MATSNTPNILSKKRQLVLQTWIDHQNEDPALREDLMNNEELRNQSEELLDAFIKAIKGGNYEDISRQEYQPIVEILTGVSLSRAH